MDLTKTRYRTIDVLRGLAIVFMVAYHITWDLVHIHGVAWPWFTGHGGWMVQRSIRWMFVLISGFCFLMGKHPVKRGLITLGCGAVVTLVTLLVLPEHPIHFGILTFLGSAMVLSAAGKPILKKCNPYAGFFLCLLLFLLTQDAESERLTFCGRELVRLPAWLYSNLFTAYLGFPGMAFSSSDYVPLIPWLFSFWMGYFAYRIVEKRRWQGLLTTVSCKPLEWLGRHSLIIYLAHQPVIYGVLCLAFL